MSSEARETGTHEPPDAPGPVDPRELPAPAENVNRFHCGQCAAELAFSPGSTHLRCPYCGHVTEIAAEATEAVERDYLAYVDQLAAAEETEEVISVKCGACGSITDRPENLDAFECVFCGADILAAEMSQRIIKPRWLLPFHIRREDAHQRFREWIRGLWFAPTKVKRFARSGGRLAGVYIPYWTYDSGAITDYTGQRGEHYWVTETYTTTENGKPVTKTRQVRKTRWYPAAGTVHNTFDDLLVLGSQSLPELALELDPWDLDNLTAYRDEYVAGFRAERYQVDLKAGFDIAREMMVDPIRRTICADIGGDVQQISSMDSRYHDITFKHVLLPVWISAYRYGDRVFRFLVNGRTGEVQGERPWSPWKIAGAIIGGLAAVGVIVAVIVIASR